MQIQFYTPKSHLLKQYLEGYYFISDNETSGTEKYLTFPNNYCIVTTNLNADVTLDGNQIAIVPAKEKNIYTSLVYRYTSPIEVYYEKPIHEITIYFKPLGLHQFIHGLNSMLLQKNMAEFMHALPDFKTAMSKIFYISDRTLQTEALESYWLSKLRLKDLGLIAGIVTDMESNMKIEDIARKHHMSRKHLNQMVLKYLGKSPTEYKKIFRFRKALGNKKDLKNLTELSYENLFYDQSHLIKDFKTFTKVTPNSFFRAVNTEPKNVWLYI